MLTPVLGISGAGGVPMAKVARPWSASAYRTRGTWPPVAYCHIIWTRCVKAVAILRHVALIASIATDDVCALNDGVVHTARIIVQTLCAGDEPTRTAMFHLRTTLLSREKKPTEIEHALVTCHNQMLNLRKKHSFYTAMYRKAIASC